MRDVKGLVAQILLGLWAGSDLPRVLRRARGAAAAAPGRGPQAPRVLPPLLPFPRRKDTGY